MFISQLVSKACHCNMQVPEKNEFGVDCGFLGLGEPPRSTDNRRAQLRLDGVNEFCNGEVS